MMNEKTRKTKGQIEAEISEAIIRFEKEYLGRGPLEIKTYLVEDMVLVRIKGIMTQAEHQLAKSADSARGRELIKSMREELVERGRPLLESSLETIMGRKVISLHTDISTITGERIFVFSLDAPPEFQSRNG
jgi:uncharacterized protein YbcI